MRKEFWNEYSKAVIENNLNKKKIIISVIFISNISQNI